MKGYKVFNPDWTCRGFQYEMGKSYEMKEQPVMCTSGFHFCEKLIDCFNYYQFDPNNKVAEVEAFGVICENADETKCCTNGIRIIRELTWYEVLDLVNTGNYNSGYRNSGNYNSGYWNSGNYNSGNYNSGDWNSGNYNSGNYNSGYRNSGNYNSGDWNSGNYNSGNYNSGDWNSGNYNSGDYNSGDWNSGNYNTGCFNTETPPVSFFDKPSTVSLEDWYQSDAISILRRIDYSPVEWVPSNEMTDEEKENNPNHETTGGYLRTKDMSNVCTDWWVNLTDDEKNIIRDIPNFDAEKFSKIMGIPVNLLEE